MRTRYSRAVWAGFELVFRPWMRRRLDGIHVRGTEHTTWLPSLPILLVANHISWWDGFLLREVHRRLRPRAPLHVVMAERELRRHPVFRWMGAVPLSDGPMAARSLLHGLEARREASPEAVFGLFPQGRIMPAHHRPLGFRPGAAWLAARMSPITVIPVGLHLEPLTRPGPAAFVSLGQPRIIRGPLPEGELEMAVARQVDGLLRWTGRYGEDAGRRWGEAA